MSAPLTAPRASAEVATAAQQLRRILDLVPRVADGEPRRVADLAALAGVDPKTVLKDLRALSSRYDAPGGFVEGLVILLDGDEVEVSTPHFQRPMRLTVAELRALELGLAIVAAERPPEEQRAIAGARTRVRACLAGGSRAVEALAAPDAVVAPDGAAPLDARGRALLDALREARLARRKVRLRYRKAHVDGAADRVVCPYALVAAQGCWYLVAFCETGQGVRVFRVDRIAAAEATDEPFAVRPDFRLGDVVRDGRVFATAEEPEQLVVRYSPVVARWIREREPGGRAEPDGSYVVAHPLADEAWAVRHVLQYGAEAEVLAPESVREAIVARLDEVVGLR